MQSAHQTRLRPSNDHEDPYISLRAIVDPLLRRKRLFLISFGVLFALLATLFLVTGSPYEAHTSILVTRDRMDPLVTTASTQQMMGVTPPLTDQEINSEVELLKSHDILEKVVIANGLDVPKGKSIFDLLHAGESKDQRRARAVRSLADKIKVETPTKTNVINVTYKSSNPETAYGVLNSLTQLYLEKHAEIHRPQGSYQVFSAQAEAYKDALTKAENRLRELGQKNNVSDPDEERTYLAQQLANNVGQLQTTEQAIAADQQRIRSDEQQMHATPERSATKEDVNASDVLLQQLGAALLAAQTKRTQLVLKYDPNYPLVKEADQEVAAVQAAIAEAKSTSYTNKETDRDPTYELLREDLVKSKSDLAAHQAALAATRQSVAALQTRMVELGTQSLAVADLQRDVKANEQNYLLYLGKQEQERTSAALDRTRVEDVAIAVPPSVPVLPMHGPAYAVALAFILALVLSIAMTYGADYFDPSFHSAGQIRDELGIPVVVAIDSRRSA
ncbi:MAG TPA: Wzz/FepE/Etk N-terminal domain-containing protein [Silvibacterium sp.]|nr:Wzz/FepE/Etk N-terminal domain-containing protein [Silvibacterium sp.]